MTNKEQAEQLKQEAIRILGMSGIPYVNAMRIIDCIIKAAQLEKANDR